MVVSRSSSNTKGDILNIKTEIPQATLSLEKNVLKCTSTVWARIYVIKLWNSKAVGIAGNITRISFRSGQNGIKNIYIDFYDSNNSKTSLAFTIDGENTIKFLVNDEEKWKVVVK